MANWWRGFLQLPAAARAAVIVGSASVVAAGAMVGSGALNGGGGTSPNPHRSPAAKATATPGPCAPAGSWRSIFTPVCPTPGASPSAGPSPGSLHLGVIVNGTLTMVDRPVVSSACSMSGGGNVSLAIDHAPGILDAATGVVVLTGDSKLKWHGYGNGSCPNAPPISTAPSGNDEVVIRLLPGAASMEVEARSAKADATAATMRNLCEGPETQVAAAAHWAPPRCNEIHSAWLWSATPSANDPNGTKFESCARSRVSTPEPLLPGSGPSSSPTTAPSKCKLKANTTVHYTGTPLRGQSMFDQPGAYTVAHHLTGSVDITLKTVTRKVESDPLLTPATLDFGNVSVGTNSPRYVILSNKPDANEPLQVTSISVTPSGQGFAVGGCSGANLSPGKSCRLTVVLSAKIVGATQASVLVNDNATGSPQVLPLSGTGAPDISVSPTVVGLVQVSNTPMTPPIAITITNTTPLPHNALQHDVSIRRLQIESVEFPPNSFYVKTGSGDCAPRVLDPQEKCEFLVSLSWTALRRGQNRIYIVSNASQTPSEIILNVSPTPKP